MCAAVVVVVWTDLSYVEATHHIGPRRFVSPNRLDDESTEFVNEELAADPSEPGDSNQQFLDSAANVFNIRPCLFPHPHPPAPPPACAPITL